MTPLALTAIAVVALLVAEAKESSARLAFKTVASSGFVWAALINGWPTTPVGSLLLAGLVLSFWADLALVPERGFLAGLVLFALAHLAYIVGFSLAGQSILITISVALIAFVAYRVVRDWLIGHVPLPLRRPVTIYMVLISLMLITAAGTTSTALLTGAALFYLSDLAVARHRFVVPSLANKMIGLPLYYAGQLVLAGVVR